MLVGAPYLNCPRLIWSTKNPLTTYRKEIVDTVYSRDPQAVVIDTSINRRPDLAEEGYRLYTETKAEAVFVISNKMVTRKVVYTLETRGVVVFAPIFDS